MTSYNVYDNLYNTMKNGLTVVKDGNEYSLGDYMLMKAGKQKEKSMLPTQQQSNRNQHAINAFFSYVNDKLTVKEPPVKDKTIKAFPFRTSLAAFISALIVCTIAITYGALTTKTNNSPVANGDTAETNQTMEITIE